MDFLSFYTEDLLIRSNMEVCLLEMHNLSYFYHWSREECWNTPCTERGVWNDRIRKQLKAESGESNYSSNSNNPPKYKEA